MQKCTNIRAKIRVFENLYNFIKTKAEIPDQKKQIGKFRRWHLLSTHSRRRPTGSIAEIPDPCGFTLCSTVSWAEDTSSESGHVHPPNAVLREISKLRVGTSRDFGCAISR